MGTEFLDDLDMTENVLPRVEFLREFLLNKLKGMLLCWEKRFVDDSVVDEVGWHDVVSYRKGMIGWMTKAGVLFWFRKWRGFRVEYWLRSNVAVCVCKLKGNEQVMVLVSVLIDVCLSVCLDGKQRHSVGAFL